jgi:hypothetical protein
MAARVLECPIRAIGSLRVAPLWVIVLGMARGSFDTMVKDAVMEGPSGEARLVGMLGSLRGAEKVMVVAALGDAQGEQGVPALRGLLAARPRSVDLRCAALLALAKRAGAEASDVLAAHLVGVPAAVADYATIGLAAVGDDRAWPQVHARLQRQLGQRPAPVIQPAQIIMGVNQFEVLLTIAYLVRHLGGSPTERIPQLVATMRSGFDRFYRVEQDWLNQHWPGIAPDGPASDQIAPPDPEPFRSLVHATHLFGPVY